MPRARTDEPGSKVPRQYGLPASGPSALPACLGGDEGGTGPAGPSRLAPSSRGPHVSGLPDDPDEEQVEPAAENDAMHVMDA